MPLSVIPPFHQGIHTNYDASEGLCQNAKKHLKASGELWIVANRFLNYQILIESTLVSVRLKLIFKAFKCYMPVHNKLCKESP